MSEATANVEFAHKIHEQGHHESSSGGHRNRKIEILEAVVLAVVAVATAWSGYQAAKWDALSAKQYNVASRTMVVSQEQDTLAGQDRLYDIVTFNAWVFAKLAGRDKLTDFYQRRFRPEYASAFDAWWKLDPVNNPAAPPGPIFMPEYANAHSQESAKLAAEAKTYFEEGVSMRENGDRYVKVTVFLATVLLLTALGQRFEIFGPRVAVVLIALLLLVISTYWVLTLPRA
ncbi:MAG: hypothetical protein ABSD20_15240 [Terriglobales bacterium]|jgi:hypothetical protein